MHKGINPKEPVMNSPVTTTLAAEKAAPTKLFPIILSKNYVPMGKYEVLGYLKEAVKRKDAAGNWKIIEAEEFIKGEIKPHQSPGVGFGPMEMKDGSMVNAKIWAGTHIGVPLEEAKYTIAKKIAERADELAA